MKRLHAIISGRVQGVSFRAWAYRTAVSLGLAGWVRNLTDGTVETVAEGPAKAIAQYAGAIRAGPPAARVENAEVSESEPTGEFSGFEVIY
ncbi:acylphosphatase [Candidatus Gottesmanbacteria bacterium RBG_16_52_11]|uniref:Acylphosphatase n=1 Tax=Candidatus Gottesmanbacteria bacterium RBG_16_52_11 TaxID=1798374 RepID=A0A1F5YVS8_9BACT|nr:MAG: acylphosphatase [Candidatus Gottesmanbacteria bacterium RBG_16_52_11]